jgi:hypothetical protein
MTAVGLILDTVSGHGRREAQGKWRREQGELQPTFNETSTTMTTPSLREQEVRGDHGVLVKHCWQGQLVPTSLECDTARTGQ